MSSSSMSSNAKPLRRVVVGGEDENSIFCCFSTGWVSTEGGKGGVNFRAIVIFHKKKKIKKTTEQRVECSEVKDAERESRTKSRGP